MGYLDYVPRGKDGYPLTLGSEPSYSTVRFSVPATATLREIAAAAQRAGAPAHAVRGLRWIGENGCVGQGNGCYPNSRGKV